MDKKVINKKDLVEFIESGCKPKNDWKIGTEHEKFGFFRKDFKPISYDDINVLFSELHKKFGWKKIFENNLLIALEKAGSTITLEPGGQIELSGAPLNNLFHTCQEVTSHQFELNSVSRPMGIEYMGMGCLPKWKLDQIPIMPKQRYEIMRKYMQKTGTNGLDMMLRTSTIQANLDYDSELDMIKKFRVSLSIQPAVIALYANSPFIEGELTNYLSYRSWIWTQTDQSRCGILPFVFDESFSFESYVDYLLDIPMYFVKRNGQYIDCSGDSFKKFMEGGLEKLPGIFPTLDDWNDHLTIAFPEVRLKKYLEVRGADGGPWSSVCALPAFWAGILYDSDVLDETWNLVSSWTDMGRQNFYDDVAKSGLQSKTPDNLDIKVFLKKLLQLSSKGLSRRAIFNEEKKNETIFLNTLSSILDSGESPAEVWKKLFLEKWEQNIDIIYKSNSF